VRVVLAAMWLAGAALIGLFVLAFYFLVQLLWMAAGAF